MRVLGIETSCDETSAAVVESDGRNFDVKSNVVSSQIKIHAKYGGVVPEMAARKHVEAILPVVEEALASAQKNKETKSQRNKSSSGLQFLGSSVDAIAVASGPGLITSLLVGNETARVLSCVWQKPLAALNHIEAHIYANWLAPIGEVKSQKSKVKSIEFPALCLVVSGGHTELILMRGHGKYEVVGATRDDAAGECFDKAAKILGLGYPGGPAIAREAEQWKFEIRNSKSETNSKFQIPKLPRPMLETPDFDFSFSGLKTAVLYATRDFFQNHPQPLLEKEGKSGFVPIMASEIQEAIADVLIAKTIRAAKKYNVKTVMLAGGVSANKRLRERFVEAMENNLPNTKYQIPDTKYCTDNAAMVAAAGYFYAVKKDFTDWRKLKVDPNWEL
jgi:N6-L-threonylcarbamoyladenine synthase